MSDKDLRCQWKETDAKGHITSVAPTVYLAIESMYGKRKFKTMN